MAFGRIALLGDAAYVARPHVARGAIKAGHDAMALAAALTDAPVVDGLQRYDAVRRPASLALVAQSRRLGAYLERRGERTGDPVAFMRENGGVEPLWSTGDCSSALDRSRSRCRWPVKSWATVKIVSHESHSNICWNCDLG